jgi:hypothetical protein
MVLQTADIFIRAHPFGITQNEMRGSSWMRVNLRLLHFSADKVMHPFPKPHNHVFLAGLNPYDTRRSRPYSH